MEDEMEAGEVVSRTPLGRLADMVEDYATDKSLAHN